MMFYFSKVQYAHQLARQVLWQVKRSPLRVFFWHGAMRIHADLARRVTAIIFYDHRAKYVLFVKTANWRTVTRGARARFLTTATSIHTEGAIGTCTG